MPGYVGGMHVRGKAALCHTPRAVDMVIGDLYQLPHLTGVPRREALRLHTNLIMRRIAALLPPHHRGDYPHPEREPD